MTAEFNAHQYRNDRERKEYIRRSAQGRKSKQSIKKLNLEMAERFRQWLMAQKYAASTQDRYLRVASSLCEHIGARSLASVTAMDIVDYLTRMLPQRWADSYIVDKLGALRSFFDFLYLG